MVSNVIEKGIQKIKSFSEVDFNVFTKEDLVLFDVDITLIQHTDMFLTHQHTQEGQAFLIALAEKGYFNDSTFWSDMVAIIVASAQTILIEEDVIERIKQLQKVNVPVCAITKMQTGKWGSFERLEEWRYQHLRSLGFEGYWNNDIFYFEGLEGKPMFYQGILITDLEEKGPTLGAFLNWKQFQPAKVIMFDDRFSYLESVQKVCKERDILFQGYHYQGALIKDWNEELAQFQIGHLIEHRKWLNDSEALETMITK